MALGQVRVEIDNAKLRKAPGLMRLAARTSLREVVEQIRDDAKIFAPVDEGDLKASIRSEINPTGLSGFVIAEAPHAASVEFGARPHTIRPRESAFLHFFVNGEEVFTKEVKHPGQTAQPFMRPALDKNNNRFRSGIAIGRAFLRRIKGG